MSRTQPIKPKIGQEDEFAAAPPTTRRLIRNLGVEDLNLPKSMVTRIAKGVLPANTAIQKDALLAISKSSTVFVNYLASHANDCAALNNKKTIQPQDVFQALRDLEFGGFAERCQEEEMRYAASLNDKRNSYRHRVRQEAARKAEKGKDPNAGGPTDESERGGARSRPNDDPPASKKPRLSGDASAYEDDSAMLDPDNEEDGDTIDEDEGFEDGEDDEDDADLGDQDEEDRMEEDTGADSIDRLESGNEDATDSE